jgi:hypothetical protein
MKPSARELLDRMKNATGPAGVLDIPAGQLAARVERVLALHTKGKIPHRGKGDWCLDCDCGWPCPTVRILDGEEDK